jgi:hypothetical protein
MEKKLVSNKGKVRGTQNNSKMELKGNKEEG